AFDDGQDSGETVRIRVPSFVIGRVEGDLVIPHDGGMSGRHAEIARRLVDGRFRWSLRDLGSTNGTFARTARALLRDGQGLLVGRWRYRFEVPRDRQEPFSVVRDPGAWFAKAKQPVSLAGEAAAPTPRLVELRPQGEGPAFPITQPETWIGHDPRQCAV